MYDFLFEKAATGQTGYSADAARPVVIFNVLAWDVVPHYLVYKVVPYNGV